jgi:hypothetical protein
MQLRRWWLLLNQEESTVPTPTLSSKLRRFTVHPAHHRIIGWIGLMLCGLLLLAAVVLVILGVAHGNRDNSGAQGNGYNGYFVGAIVCGFFLLTLGWTISHRIVDRLEVDESGVHITHGRRTQSIPWDQLEYAGVERVTNEGGFNTPFIRRLVVSTPTKSIPSVYGLDTDDGRLPQIVATIRSYRDQVRAGTAKWEPITGDDATYYRHDRQLPVSSPPLRYIWDPDNWSLWLLRVLVVLTFVALIVLAALGLKSCQAGGQ